jgi:hypothetical protein
VVWFGLMCLVWFGVVWCGWCSWCGLVWCGVVWFGVVWCGNVVGLVGLVVCHLSGQMHFVGQLAQLKKTVNTAILYEFYLWFGCVIGCYDTWEEAQVVLLWRALVCAGNAVTDATYQARAPRQIRHGSTAQQLTWLLAHGVSDASGVSLAIHHAHGTTVLRHTSIPAQHVDQNQVNIVQFRPLDPGSSVLSLARQEQLHTLFNLQL